MFLSKDRQCRAVPLVLHTCVEGITSHTQQTVRTEERTSNLLHYLNFLFRPTHNAN